MLYIDITKKQNQTTVSKSWHVGNPAIYVSSHQDVESVQADGHELQKILRMCKNIPTTDASVMVWFGDHAKFIAFSCGIATLSRDDR